MNKTALTLFILLLFLHFIHSDLTISDKHNSDIHSGRDSVYLTNRSDKRIGFSFEDNFLNLTRLHLKPNSSQKIWVGKELLLTQSNENQNFYLLDPGDCIIVDLNSKGDAVLSDMKDSIRNNELNLSWQMNENTPLNFWKINKLIGKYFDKDYKKLDSIYNADYRSKISFLNGYIQLHPISKKYEERIRSYLKSQLLGSQLWLGTASKDKIDLSYLKYLASLKDEVQSLSEDSVEPIYNRLKYVYLKFELRELFNNNKDKFTDSIYARFRRESKSAIREEMLFYISKSEIESNRTSKKWFIDDFLQTNTNEEFKKYIETTIENNELIAKAGNSTILINTNSEKTDYKSLLNSLKGKVIYIDVWASWCAPCRSEMPNSAILRSLYNNKEIVFLYISIDEQIMDWKKANKEEKLDNYPYSFVVLNALKNDFVKQFKIATIPRYIVLDRKGKVVNLNAPRPGDPEINRVLDSLVK